MSRGLIARQVALALLVAAAAGIAGCAGAPALPVGLDLASARLQPLEAAPQVRLEEEGWRGPATRTGGWAGMGMGLGLSGLACAATGPLAVLCYVSVVPLATAVGAVGGAVVGKSLASHAEGVADKAALLQSQWSALAQRAPLAQAVERLLPVRVPAGAAGGSSGPAPGEAPGAAAAAQPQWLVHLGYATLGTVGSGPGKPFALQGTARLQVWQAGRALPEADRVYSAISNARLTLEQWRADEALALRRALDELGAALAAQAAGDLASGASPRP